MINIRIRQSAGRRGSDHALRNAGGDQLAASVAVQIKKYSVVVPIERFGRERVLQVLTDLVDLGADVRTERRLEP